MSGGKFGVGGEELYCRMNFLSGRMAAALRVGDDEKAHKYELMMEEVSDQIGENASKEDSDGPNRS